MVFLIDGKKVRLNPYNMRYSEKIGETVNSAVYLIGGKAYKLYKPYGQKELITKDIIKHYKNIPTEKIKLPTSPILDKKRRLQGYISEYVKDLGIEQFMKQDIKTSLSELKLLENDFILLGEHNILVNDANYENTVFNKGANLIDSGRFQKGQDENISISYNQEAFNEYLINQIICKYIRLLKKSPKNLKKEYLKQISQGINLLDYIEKDAKEENLDEYLKRKSR